MRGVLKVFDGANWKPTGVVVNQNIAVTQYISPFNYAHNSDFTQWVAQAGIGGSHGNQAYGGDRWILDSGTITGTARADGNGYENVTLNGTIRQIVANPPATGTVGVDMISGTATASYANGEITITSSGGVIKDVWLYEGTYEAGAAPKFQPKGYGVELAECLLAFVRYTAKNNMQFAAGGVNGNLCFAPVWFSLPMRAIPSLSYSALADINLYNYKSGGAASISALHIEGQASTKNAVVLRAAYTNSSTVALDAQTPAAIRILTGGFIDFCADYE